MVGTIGGALHQRNLGEARFERGRQGKRVTVTAGYDVGGAHLKVALGKAGRMTDARQIPWRAVERA
jgi:hypothetical protein